MTFQMLFWSCKAMVRLYANGPAGPPTPDVDVTVIGLVVGRSNPVLRFSITASPSASCYPQYATVWRLQGSSLIWSQNRSYKVGGDRSDQMLLAFLAVIHLSTNGGTDKVQKGTFGLWTLQTTWTTMSWLSAYPVNGLESDIRFVTWAFQCSRLKQEHITKLL